jgi:hypothetical protein
VTMAFVNDVSLRQLLVPDRFLGRVSATANVLGVVAMPVGALAGGLIGQLASPRMALAVGAIGFSVSSLWIVTHPIRTPEHWSLEIGSPDPARGGRLRRVACKSLDSGLRVLSTRTWFQRSIK